jgi:putative ABC transport system substrate-binding protein
MRRREFIAGLGSAAAWPLVARAQQRALPVIGLFGTQTADNTNDFIVGFLQSLKESGYVEGRNFAIEYRWAENQYDRLPAFAADLVRRRVAVIVAAADAAALAAKAATTTIPIVFLAGGDPVALGLVASLNRPGGNLTGIAFLTAELGPKRLQLLRDLIPNAAAFGVLADPEYPSTQSVIADLQEATRTLGGPQLVIVNARTDGDLEPALQLFRNSTWCGPGQPWSPPQPARATSRGAGRPPCAARDLPEPRVRPGRRPDELWQQHRLSGPPTWHLYGAYSQRRETSRSAG